MIIAGEGVKEKKLADRGRLNYSKCLKNRALSPIFIFIKNGLTSKLHFSEEKLENKIS